MSATGKMRAYRMKHGLCVDCGGKSKPFYRCTGCRKRHNSKDKRVAHPRGPLTAEEKRAREARQLRFIFKRTKTVQRFGTGIVVNLPRVHTDSETYRKKVQGRILEQALKREGMAYPRPVVTPEWIEEDRKEEMRELSMLRWGAKL